METTINSKSVVKHIVDGTLATELCRICLMPLEDDSENIFSRICTQSMEYSVAEILEAVCQMEFSETTDYYACKSCYRAAIKAYQFWCLTKQSNEVIEFYVDKLESSIHNLYDPGESICITLPEYNEKFITSTEVTKLGSHHEDIKETKPLCELVKKEESDDIIKIVDGNGDAEYYKVQTDGTWELFKKKTPKVLTPVSITHVPMEQRVRKVNKKRDPMVYISCTKCPVKYRMIPRLKEHMEVAHGIEVYVCKICKTLYEDKNEFHSHLTEHKGVYQCNICAMNFKRRDSIISHLKWHEEMDRLKSTGGVHICEQCGAILLTETDLKEHNEKKHMKKFTCDYCGKLYKAQASLNIHIEKHKMYGKNKVTKPVRATKPRVPKVCETCGKHFVDERALMWHIMSRHTDDRPFICDTCGRGFVSLNRRNQHSVTAHTAPRRQCPLCPALFHLRSMVNTHIKKVHLQAHKRRNRSSRHQRVYWRTQAVPLSDLSVAVQTQLLDLRAKEEANLQEAAN